MSAHVLVVEDEPAIRGLIAETLEEDGFTVATAANGQEALARIAEDPPCLLLLDLEMPVLTGWEVLRALRERRLPVPVVLMSAGMRVQQEAAQQQTAGYLAKPFALDDLVATVARFTQRR